MNKRRYIQLFDKNGIELLGTDQHFNFDNRLTNKNALNLCYEAVQKQGEAYLRDPKKYVKPKAYYAAIVEKCGTLRDPRILNNPT